MVDTCDGLRGRRQPIAAYLARARIKTDATAALRAKLGKNDRLTLDSFTQALADLKTHLTPTSTAPICGTA